MDFDEKKEPNKKKPRKGKKPTRFKPVDSTSRPVKTLESKVKRISLETDSDVLQKKNNTTEENHLVRETPVLESTSRSVKALEADQAKSKGKRIALETDSDVQLKKRNTCRETPLVIKEPVPENLSIASQFKPNQINERQDKKPESVKNPPCCGFGLENCVKILRQMEFSEHIDKDFRQSFLSWYSLRAEAEEVKVARTFISAFKDDLEALAEQLIDAFSDTISKKKRPAPGDGDGASSSGAFFKKPRLN